MSATFGFRLVAAAAAAGVAAWLSLAALGGARALAPPSVASGPPAPRAPLAPLPVAASPAAALPAPAAPASAASGAPSSAADAALAALPPEDAEWVLDEAARYEAARSLGAADREALISQLASARTHVVLERTEPWLTEPEEGR